MIENRENSVSLGDKAGIGADASAILLEGTFSSPARTGEGRQTADKVGNGSGAKSVTLPELTIDGLNPESSKKPSNETSSKASNEISYKASNETSSKASNPTVSEKDDEAQESDCGFGDPEEVDAVSEKDDEAQESDCGFGDPEEDDAVSEKDDEPQESDCGFGDPDEENADSDWVNARTIDKTMFR